MGAEATRTGVGGGERGEGRTSNATKAALSERNCVAITISRRALFGVRTANFSLHQGVTERIYRPRPGQPRESHLFDILKSDNIV